MNNLTSLKDRVLAGEKVRCPKCNKGVIVPTFPEHKTQHDYKCDSCDYKIHFEPNVIVE